MVTSLARSWWSDNLTVMPVMSWPGWLDGIVIVDVVVSAGVPEPPVPEEGMGRGTFVDAIGPMTGLATGVVT